MNYLPISRKLFSFCLINPQLSWFVRKVSVKCSERVVMNLHIIGSTFVNIRMNSHTLHFHHSHWFQIVRDCWIYLYREQSGKILTLNQEQRCGGRRRRRQCTMNWRWMWKTRWSIFLALPCFIPKIIKIMITWIAKQNSSHIWRRAECTSYVLREKTNFCLIKSLRCHISMKQLDITFNMVHMWVILY